MKLVAPQLELRVIKTLTSVSSQKESSKLFASVNEHCFHTKSATECYHRIFTVLRARGTLLTWGELYSDPVISEAVRKKLKAFKERPIPLERLDRTISLLHKYRRMREYFHLSQEIVRDLNKTKVDIDEMDDKVAKRLASARVNADVNKWFLHVGAKDKSDIKAVKKALSPDNFQFIPTGFAAFDNINHGVPRGSLMLLAGPTGSGKSALSGQLAENMAKAGARVCVIPLEMKNEEMLQRQLSRSSDIEMQRIINPKDLTDLEKKRIIGRYIRLRKRIRKMDAKLSMFAPEEDMYLEEILFATQPFDYDVEIIDYIGLLKGVGGDDQWRAMRNITRFGKRYASIHNKVIIICAQLSEEGLIRYSKGMVEDASNAFFIQPNSKTEATGVIMIDQPKARNQRKFKFPLASDLSRMTFRDLTDSEKQELENVGKDKAKKSKKGKKQDDDFFQDDD